MDNGKSVKEYEILGYKVKLRPSGEDKSTTPDKIVCCVRERANSFLDKMPHLSCGEAALLVALSLAQEKFELQEEFCKNVDDFHKVAEETLQFIEEVSPGLS